MNATVMIKEITADKGEICNRILRLLPSWFGIEEAIVNYARGAEDMVMFGANVEGRIVGFISLKPHNRFTTEINVIGIEKPFHHRGIGRKLAEKAEAYLKRRGFEYLSVKTLGPSRESSEYARTRKFFEWVGFRPVEEFKTLWDEDNPCLLMIKKLV